MCDLPDCKSIEVLLVEDNPGDVRLITEALKDAKIHVRAFLTRAGMPPSWTMDEGDAFVAANWAVCALGGFAFASEPPVDEKRPSRRKAA